MMEVENFQSLSMAEKLKLWKMKTGRASNCNKPSLTSSSLGKPTSRTKSPGTSIVSKTKSPKPENTKLKSPMSNEKPKDITPVESSASSMMIQVEDKENNNNNNNTSPNLSEKAISFNELGENHIIATKKCVALNAVTASPSQETNENKEALQPSSKPQQQQEEQEHEQEQQSAISTKRRDTMALGVPLIALPLSSLDAPSPDDSCDRRKSHITFSRGREDYGNGRRVSKASKRQSMWGALPMSPLVVESSSPASDSGQRRGSMNKNDTSTDSLEDLRGLTKSPSLTMRRLSTGSNGKDSCEDIKKKRSSIDKIFPSGLSPVITNTIDSTISSIILAEKDSSVSSVLSQSTPYSANQKIRDSTGYYTANESIEEGQSISDESKEFIEFSNENTPTSLHYIDRRSSSGSVASDGDHRRKSISVSTSRRGSVDHGSSAKILQLENSLESATAEIERLKTEVNNITKEKMILDVKVHSMEDQRNDFETKARAFYEEVQSHAFLNSVLEQKNDELQCQISSDRLDRNEHLQSKTKKLKAEIQRLTEEKKLYEERANEMCKEMSEQMSLLQSTAMARIESLESDLLQERKEREEIEVKLRQTKQAAMMKSLKGSVVDVGRKSDSSDDTECTNSTEERYDEDEEDDGTPTK